MDEEINELIDEKIEELYNSLMEKPLQVLGIFNDFFGEERVDMQGYMSLGEFKSWMESTFMNVYVFDREQIGMSTDEWNKYRYRSIKGLPVSQITKVVSNFQAVKDTIVRLNFSDIFILVHFPHVRVINEHNRFVDINHLWAKVRVSSNGTLRGSFTLNRSEYTMLHMVSNYLHSHVNRIPMGNFTEFQHPCTGDGPINITMDTLNNRYDEDMWNMFCLELSKFVTVESLMGVPYNYLERIGTDNMIVGASMFIAYTRLPYQCVLSTERLRKFVRYFINRRKLKFNYVNGSYSIGMSLPEYIILVSNEFISWYNDLFNKGEVNYTFGFLKSRDLLEECIIGNGKIYYEIDMANVNSYLGYVGKKVCMFKGKEITISITDIGIMRNESKSVILNVQIALYILSVVLKVLNYRYGRETDATEGNQLGTKVRYL